MKLHRRLTLTMAVLLIVGLAVADVVTYTSLRSFLFGRLDAQVASAENQAYRYLVFESSKARVATTGGLDDRVAPDVYVLVVGANGMILVQRPSGSDTTPDPQPQLPAVLRAQAKPSVERFGRSHGAFRPDPNTIQLAGKNAPDAEYRATAIDVPQGILVTAVSVDPTTDTLNSLLKVELLISGAVVILLCITAIWTVRRGLRPLEDMATTAGEIADGDFSRRIPQSDDQSEVGRLGAALNTMLVEIEAAFAEKSISEQRLRQFVADASHELRTPLTSIRGYTELLQKDAFSDDERRDRALSRVQDEAARMGGLIEDLLVLARLDQGRPLEHKPVDLCSVFSHAIEDARAVARTRKIKFLRSSEVLVAGDRDQIGQIAHNLIRNAITHTPEGTQIRVEVSRGETMGIVEVIDHGPGLSAIDQARVFDRFFRSDTSRTGGGSGLGLSIVKAIAEASGGSASVSSRPGRGATFRVELPLLARTGPRPRSVRVPKVERLGSDEQVAGVGSQRQENG